MCTMIRSTALLLLLLPACAGTQSQRAFIPRPAAAFVPSVTTPNTSAERDHELADCFERSVREQEDRDRGAEAPAMMPEEATRAHGHRRAADRAPLASFR